MWFEQAWKDGCDGGIWGINKIKKVTRWSNPPRDYMKITIVGVPKKNPSMASCGEVLCDRCGSQVARFVENLSNCPYMVAEMQGLVIGIQVRWDSGF